MLSRSGLDVFKHEVSMIARERVSRVRRHFASTWNLWVLRAKTWEETKTFYELEGSLGPGEAVSYEGVAFHEELLSWHESQRLCRLAKKLHIYIPADHFEWVSLSLSDERVRCLKEDAVAKLAPKVQEAARLRRNEIAQWVSLTIGTIGALTGLFAVVG